MKNVQTAEEDKVRELYNHWNDWMGNDGHYSSQTIASTIVDVLNALNIKIPGVNVAEPTYAVYQCPKCSNVFIQPWEAMGVICTRCGKIMVEVTRK